MCSEFNYVKIINLSKKTLREYIQILMVPMLGYDIVILTIFFLTSEFHIFDNVVTFCNEKSNLWLSNLLSVFCLNITCKLVEIWSLVMEFLWIRKMVDKYFAYTTIFPTGSVDGWPSWHGKDPPCQSSSYRVQDNIFQCLFINSDFEIQRRVWEACSSPVRNGECLRQL